ncbi:Cytochrome c oxidase subunit 6B [Mortierella polycephala]|uniref:Cytochrome c oxidase subunit n=1 Tax=Mortierella polycephala TaxID=41804 RepID=A0A9P6PKA0_9FUNG|nr:Cytochrome c oxidase subunit 6B [Mortierella polycephala]
MSDNAEIKLETAPFDARFPNTNQSKHCWQAYGDYYKCIDARGEDFAPCQQFKKTFMSICPEAWVSRWDEQREDGTIPFKVTV